MKCASCICRSAAGQYAVSLDHRCRCGCRKGEHLAGKTGRSVYECTVCDCQGFKAANVRTDSRASFAHLTSEKSWRKPVTWSDPVPVTAPCSESLTQGGRHWRSHEDRGSD
jgi:hypothetical protein